MHSSLFSWKFSIQAKLQISRRFSASLIFTDMQKHGLQVRLQRTVVTEYSFVAVLVATYTMHLNDDNHLLP